MFWVRREIVALLASRYVCFPRMNLVFERVRMFMGMIIEGSSHPRLATGALTTFFSTQCRPAQEIPPFTGRE